MGRVIDPNHVGKQRTYLIKATLLTIRELAPRQDVDDEARDMAAFIALCLEQISKGINVTIRAWEKRNYWLKADRFQREWAWSDKLGGQLRAAVLQDDWGTVAQLLPQVAARLNGKIKLPKRNTIGRAWPGSYKHLTKQEKGVTT